MARVLNNSEKSKVGGLLLAGKSLSKTIRLVKVSRVSIWHISKAYKERNGL